ncbi:hypothetical protein HDU79_005752 [Rhizoclosmatium sp. JEL0117]|nr:hypothetical protein HDU79_005752 [Rhizoclosmatium sp. JEL0117]
MSNEATTPPTSGNPYQTLMDAHKFIRLMWTSEEIKAKFTSVWDSLNDVERRKIAKAVAPRSPESRENPIITGPDGEQVDMSDFISLLPELCTANLVKGNVLPNIFQALTEPGTFAAVCYEQIALLRYGIMNGFLEPPPTRTSDPNLLIVIYVDEDFGRLARLVPETEPNHAELNADFLKMKEKGFAIEPFEFELLMGRMKFLIEHAVLMFHAIRDYDENRVRGCWGCGKDQTADGGKLLKCVKCGEAQYCSRECQVTGWKGGHKEECARIVAAKAARE